MVTNHLTPDLLPFEVGGMYSPGYGYGLGFRVAMDPGQCQVLATEGEYGWAGAASTYFWIDPVEEFIGVVMSAPIPQRVSAVNLPGHRRLRTRGIPGPQNSPLRQSS